jgi:MFS family permease
LGAPFFVAFGALSDRIGRRNIMSLGFALAVISYWPVFTWLGTFKDNPVVLTILVFYMVILVTMVYGPIAAFLVELFPARIRYTSMSLPYHVGNGVFGGLVPAAGASIAARRQRSFATGRGLLRNAQSPISRFGGVARAQDDGSWWGKP